MSPSGAATADSTPHSTRWKTRLRPQTAVDRGDPAAAGRRGSPAPGGFCSGWSVRPGTLPRVGSARDRRSTNAEPDGYHWPVEDMPEPPRPGVVTLLVLYLAPFLLLLLFPTIAWIALLPLTPVVSWTTHPAHRRRAVWIYLVTGLISLAPWVALLFD